MAKTLKDKDIKSIASDSSTPEPTGALPRADWIIRLKRNKIDQDITILHGTNVTQCYTRTN